MDKMFRNNLILSRDLNDMKKPSMRNWSASVGGGGTLLGGRSLQADADLFSRNSKEVSSMTECSSKGVRL